MKYLYYKFLYRHIMRLMHHYNIHRMKPNPYIDPDRIIYRCHWCGLFSEKLFSEEKKMKEYSNLIDRE